LRGLVLVDLDGDGLLDVAVTDAANNAVNVLKNLGDGGFAKLSGSFGTDTGPEGLSAGDLNGDGLPDLAVATDNGTVSVLLNTGGGTFAQRQDYPISIGTSVAVSPPMVAIGDLNGDGAPDLVVPNGAGEVGAGAVAVLLSEGNGRFASPVTYATDNLPWAAAIADFDGDGLPDLAISCRNAGTVNILRNHGGGVFEPRVSYPGCGASFTIASGDFNRDGWPDLAVVSVGESGVCVLLNQGSGVFGAPKAYVSGRGATGLALADFNGDGLQDFAVNNTLDNDVGVLLDVCQ
jgi:hypothetical protein